MKNTDMVRFGIVLRIGDICTIISSAVHNARFEEHKCIRELLIFAVSVIVARSSHQFKKKKQYWKRVLDKQQNYCFPFAACKAEYTF